MITKFEADRPIRKHRLAARCRSDQAASVPGPVMPAGFKRLSAAVLALSLGLCLSTRCQAGNADENGSAAGTRIARSEDKSETEAAAAGESQKTDESEGKKGKDKRKARDKNKDAEEVKDAEKGNEKDEKKVESKGDEKAAKKDARAEDENEKKKGGGLFHLGGRKKDREEGEQKTEPKIEPAAKESPAAKPAQVEDPNAPRYKFDPALISVLKDINKSLKDSEAVTKLEDPAQKLVARLAGDALEKGLANSELHANRIVDPKDKERMEKTGMTAEAWESGNIEVSPELKASVAALWAKRIDGLITVEIVGNYEGKVEGASEKLGEFVAVITAHSTVDKGFDIQSQQDVNFWIGKVSDLKIDCTSGKPPDPNLKSHLQQYVPITQRKREFLLAVKEYQDKLAKAEEDKKKQSELSATQKVAEALARTFSEALAKSVGAPKPAAGEKTTLAQTNAGGTGVEKKSEGVSDIGAAAAQHGSEAPAQNQAASKTRQQGDSDAGAGESAAAVKTPPASPEAARGSSVAALIPEANRSSRSSWESPAAPSAIRNPAADAVIVYPGRVVAGQYVTVAVVGPQNQSEHFVGLTFNGAQLSTGENGKVVYQVPEDMPPGYSLHIALSARPEEPAGAIEVLQPLTTPREAQIPSVEGVSPVCRSTGIITVFGHNFEGIAERNRVIVDGAYDASVLVSSPVQLKAQLPGGIPAGSHTLCVSTAGLRSNPGNFDLVGVELNSDGPEAKKLTVRVTGTQLRVRVKLVNQTPDIIRLLKGDEVVVVTSGGTQNQAQVQVQRLRPGNYKISTDLLI
jgi:hypothetical protein